MKPKWWHKAHVQSIVTQECGCATNCFPKFSVRVDELVELRMWLKHMDKYMQQFVVAQYLWPSRVPAPVDSVDADVGAKLHAVGQATANDAACVVGASASQVRDSDGSCIEPSHSDVSVCEASGSRASMSVSEVVVPASETDREDAPRVSNAQVRASEDDRVSASDASDAEVPAISTCRRRRRYAKRRTKRKSSALLGVQVCQRGAARLLGIGTGMVRSALVGNCVPMRRLLLPRDQITGKVGGGALSSPLCWSTYGVCTTAPRRRFPTASH